MGIGRLFQCLLANFVGLRQVLILALDFSSGPLTNFKGAFHKIPCRHSPLKVMIMSQKWLPSTLRKVSSQNSPTRNGALRTSMSDACMWETHACERRTPVRDVRL